LGTFEVISNSEVLKTTHTEKTEHRFEFDLPIEQSRWITARVARGDNFDALSGPDIAHTSAIYLTVDDKPVFRPEADGLVDQQYPPAPGTPAIDR